MLMRPELTRYRHAVGLGAVLVLLLVLYAPTVQTIPNGSDHYYMIDVGETQVVLNVWGTLHATGYPHYVMTGSALVAVMRALGVDAVVAPALVSLLWGLLALSLLYALAAHLTKGVLPAAAMTLLFGLTRTVWVHQVIAEIYTFGLLLIALLLVVALWRRPLPLPGGRIYWLALIGGIGVAHHRATILLAPALLIAVWGELSAEPRRIPRKLLLVLLIGLVGLVPYIYLPLRDRAGGIWVYGDPGTWAGFWAQFNGDEAARFVGLPGSWAELASTVSLINTVLITDLTLPGLVAGVIGLLLALRRDSLRRAALVMLVSGALSYLFHVTFYTDVLSALILHITLSAAFGWSFLLVLAIDGVRAFLARSPRSFENQGRTLLLTAFVALIITVVGAVYLVAHNRLFITDLTRDPTGLQTIALLEHAPDGATVMLDWGPRHFAAGVARDVRGTLGHIDLVDHQADFAALAAGMLVTPDYTFYNRPVSWWQEQIGTQVYLRAAAPNLVQVATQPETIAAAVESGAGVTVHSESVACTGDSLLLTVEWLAGEPPDADRSVFVHLLDADGNIIAQGDQSAPVYGWRPLTTWMAGELVHDIYPLPNLPAAATIRYGLYFQGADGAFVNESVRSLRVACSSMKD